MQIKIINGCIIDPVNHLNRQGSLYIAEGKIAAVFDKPAGFNADKTIDAQGQIVCPGFIDLATHLREPGQTHKATIQSETQAAASAGFTSLCVPPDTCPVIDEPAVVELIKDKAERCGYHNVYPIAALTQKLAGKELSSMYSLKQAGCIAVSHAQSAIQDLLVLRRAMEYAVTHDILLMYIPQDPALTNQGCAHEGAMASLYGLPGIPVAAETISLMQCIELIELTGCRVHFRGLSSARSVVLIAKAKKAGLPVTADVAIHHLHLTAENMVPYDSHYHVLPPLRDKQDREALVAAIQSGTIDSICSDHQPHDIDAKLGAFPETEPGIATLETVLPLMLRLVEQGEIQLSQGIAKLSSEPARILGLESGAFTVGHAADICIFDAEKQWQVNAKNWQSRGCNTPFWGETMQGQVSYTLQAGKILFAQD